MGEGTEELNLYIMCKGREKPEGISSCKWNKTICTCDVIVESLVLQLSEKVKKKILVSLSFERQWSLWCKYLLKERSQYTIKLDKLTDLYLYPKFMSPLNEVSDTCTLVVVSYLGHSTL